MSKFSQIVLTAKAVVRNNQRLVHRKALDLLDRVFDRNDIRNIAGLLGKGDRLLVSDRVQRQQFDGF